MSSTTRTPQASQPATQVPSFDELVRRHSDVVWRYAVGMLGDPDEAEEVTQDTFLRMHHHLDTWREEASLRTWILAICRNLCIDRLRRRRLHVVPLEDTAPGHLHTTPDHAEGAAVRDAIAAGVAELSDDEREAFHLVDVLGFSGAEAAAIADVPATTLRSRLARAHETLVRHVMQEDER